MASSATASQVESFNTSLEICNIYKQGGSVEKLLLYLSGLLK